MRMRKIGSLGAAIGRLFGFHGGAYETCEADGLMALISHPTCWLDGIRSISGKQARIKVELSNLHQTRAMAAASSHNRDESCVPGCL